MNELINEGKDFLFHPMNEDEKHAPSGSFGSDFLTVTHSRSNQLKSRAFPLRAPATPWIRLCLQLCSDPHCGRGSTSDSAPPGGHSASPCGRAAAAASAGTPQSESPRNNGKKTNMCFFKHLIGQFRTRRWCWS